MPLSRRSPAVAASLMLFATAAFSASHTRDAHVAVPDADGVQRVRITGGDYFFKPARIVVKANRPVELLVNKEAGMVPHNLLIVAPAAGISVTEDLATDVKKVGFTPTAPGVYPFYCDKRFLFFASHREKGMEGVLEVVP